MIIITLNAKTIYKNAIASVTDMIDDGVFTWSMAACYLDSLYKLANGENDGMISEFCNDGSIAWICPDVLDFEDSEITLVFKCNGKIVATVGNENIKF